MKFLITGACGFVGSRLAAGLKACSEAVQVTGIDNLSRRGSESNWDRLTSQGVELHHGDIRNASDLESLPPVDWVIDAAANPSVLAGVSGSSSSRNLVEHNLIGTLQILEYCKRFNAGLVLLSTSRVYSVGDLNDLPLTMAGDRYQLALENLPESSRLASCISIRGITEDFPTCSPISLYGATKLCSESLALEYAAAFGFPVWINRCGVMSGAGQFGKADQGIVAFWIDRWRRSVPLKYIGFDGTGKQVRDLLHPDDLCALIQRQVANPTHSAPRIIHCSGGATNSFSLAELSNWCAEYISPPAVPVGCDYEGRRYDVPWLILDHQAAERYWDWRPIRTVDSIFQEVYTSQCSH